jgi:hypothetical protein
MVDVDERTDAFHTGLPLGRSRLPLHVGFMMRAAVGSIKEHSVGTHPYIARGTSGFMASLLIGHRSDNLEERITAWQIARTTMAHRSPM